MSIQINTPKKYTELGQLINLRSMLEGFDKTKEVNQAKEHLNKLIAKRITELT